MSNDKNTNHTDTATITKPNAPRWRCFSCGAAHRDPFPCASSVPLNADGDRMTCEHRCPACTYNMWLWWVPKLEPREPVNEKCVEGDDKNTTPRMAPRIERDVPWCSKDDCPSYDGKRCRLLGMRPDAICEPAAQKHAAELRTARATDAAQAERIAALGKEVEHLKHGIDKRVWDEAGFTVDDLLKHHDIIENRIAALEARERALVAGLDEALGLALPEAALPGQIDRLRALAHPDGTAPASDLRALVDEYESAVADLAKFDHDCDEGTLEKATRRRDAARAALGLVENVT